MVFGPGLALALFAGLGPSEADAEARVTWEAPLECPGADSLEQRVDAYLGHALAGEALVLVSGRVRTSSAGFVLELMTEVGGVRDQQRLTHHDCAALVELAASLAAIAIDPLALAEVPVVPRPDTHRQQPPAPATASGVAIQRPNAREPSKAPPTPAELAELAMLEELAGLAEPVKPPEPAKLAKPPEPAEVPPLFELYPSSDADTHDDDRPATDTRQTRALVLATGGVALNLFPNPAPQLRGGVGLQHGNSRVAFRTQVDAGATLAGRFRSADDSAGGDLLAWDIAIRPCGVPSWGIVELRVCAAFGAGQIRARGVGVADALRRAHPWLWLAAEAGVAVEVGSNVALVLDLGVDFNLLRPNFNISDPSVSYLTPIVSGHGRLGVELRFF